VWKARHGGVAVSGVLALLILGSSFLIPALQERLIDHFGNPAQLGTLQSFYLAVGAALVGAAAIVSTLVERSMAQTNHANRPPLLDQVADQISPDTAGQAVEPNYF
jgi:hypothetical protein